MASPVNPGEDKAWEILASMSSADVCRQAKVSFDEATRSYGVRSFGTDFDVSIDEKTITGSGPLSAILLGKFGSFFRLSLLWYLVSAKDINETGRLVKLESVRGGDAFAKGSHVLPLEPLARKYGNDREGFAKAGRILGAEAATHADVSLRLPALPRIPVVLALWLGDEEFAARADLFFDSSCELQVAPDILWSIAMVSVLLIAEGSGSG